LRCPVGVQDFGEAAKGEHTKIAEEPILDAHFHQANARHAIPWQVVTADFNLY
jgi:hypothetical protein